MRYGEDGKARWRGAVLGLALLWPAPASATQEYILPTLFDVIGVAADDVLHIRARPNRESEIIGALAADARKIEVVAHDESGRWAQVNTAERSGWVVLRHLAYRTDVWGPGELPETLRCVGTEPFWSLAPKQDAVVFSRPARPDQAMTLKAVLDPGVLRSPRRAIVAEDAERSLTAVVTPAICSDGMSDKVYGLDATAILKDAQGLEMLTGCCSIAPRRTSPGRSPSPYPPTGR